MGEKATDGNIEVYLKGGVNMDQSLVLAKFMNKTMENPDHTISFAFSKDDNGKYLVQMVSDRDKANTLAEADLKEMASRISSTVADGHVVVFELTDDRFNSFRSVESQGDPTNNQ